MADEVPLEGEIRQRRDFLEAFLDAILAEIVEARGSGVAHPVGGNGLRHADRGGSMPDRGSRATAAAAIRRRTSWSVSTRLT